MVRWIQTVHGRETPVFPHQREAAADVARNSLMGMRVWMMMVVVVMMVRELVRDGGDGW